MSGCCPFKGGLTVVVVDSLSYVPSIVCGGSEIGLCFGIYYFVPFLVLQSS